MLQLRRADQADGDQAGTAELDFVDGHGAVRARPCASSSQRPTAQPTVKGDAPPMTASRRYEGRSRSGEVLAPTSRVAGNRFFNRGNSWCRAPGCARGASFDIYQSSVPYLSSTPHSLGQREMRPANRLRTAAGSSLSISGPVLVRILYIFKLGGTIDLGNSWSSAIGDLISESQATDRSTFCPNARRKASSGLRCYPH